jgi:uncharacterized protein (DUF433 family)
MTLIKGIEDFKQLIAIIVLSIVFIIGILAVIELDINSDKLLLITNITSAVAGALITVLNVKRNNETGEIQSDTTEQYEKVEDKMVETAQSYADLTGMLEKEKEENNLDKVKEVLK